MDDSPERAVCERCNSTRQTVWSPAWGGWYCHDCRDTKANLELRNTGDIAHLMGTEVWR